MRLTFGNLSIEGVSRGGDRTWFRVHPPGLAFDVGRGALGLAGARDVFITHGHIDHCLGLPFLLSHRARHEGGATRVACPAEIAKTLDAWLAGAARLEQAASGASTFPACPGPSLMRGFVRLRALFNGLPGPWAAPLPVERGPGLEPGANPPLPH